MLKPERVWKVGTRFFETYEDARKFATEERRSSVSEDILRILNDNVNWEGWTGGDDDLRAAIAEITEAFTITRKRVR